jgi:hypothetical protein
MTASMSPGQIFAIFIGIAFLVLLLALLKRTLAGPGPLPYFSREHLLSQGELAFYHALRRAVPQHLMICLKVRLADIIHCSGEAWKQGYGGRISQKHLDFVIADAASTAILLAIELDDKSHKRADRQVRDDFLERALAAAKIPLVRVPAAPNYDARALAAVITRRLEGGAAVRVQSA